MTSFIHLKGIKEPVEVSEEKARKIMNIFFDDSIQGSFVISVGDNSFRKSEIRYIRKNTEESGGKKEHWIIINTKRNSIWKQPYLSYQEAKAEFDYQVSNIHPNQKHNFVIEHRGFFDESKVSDASYKEKDDFADFDIKQSALLNL